MALNLAYNGLGDRRAHALAESPYLAKLTKLNLAGNTIGDEGARALTASPHLQNLTRLDLSNNNIGSAASAEIQRTLAARRAGRSAI